MPRRATLPRDPHREKRIADEVLVDCYNEHEAHGGRLCYLEEHIEFPVRARCVKAVKGSPWHRVTQLLFCRVGITLENAVPQVL